jgi:hypothetical protein
MTNFGLDKRSSFFCSECRRRKKFYKIDSKGHYYTTFLFVSYECAKKAGVFVPRRLFQLSLMFAGKAGAYPSEAPEHLTLADHSSRA